MTKKSEEVFDEIRNPKLSMEEASKALQLAAETELRQCQEEIEATLAKYGYAFDIKHTIQIVPKR